MGLVRGLLPKRVAERYGTDRLVLLAADTKSEHEDWYRFVEESAANVGGELVVVSAGLDIWDLAEQQRAIPNSRLAFCSRILKHRVLDAWCDEHAPDCVRFFGFDWTEAHRIDAVRARHTGAVDAPLLWKPMVDKPDLLRWLAAEGLTVPAAYQKGMPHNNCLRYGCVKGGIAYWESVRVNFPESFARSEQREQKVREQLGKNVSILRSRRGGTSTPLTLRTLREQAEAQPSLFDDSQDWGACNCF